MHLSKSDFKVARTCPTKLYYRKLRFPATTDGDPYLEFLADGGYMVETIAKLLFPAGREIRFGQGEDAVAQTTAVLQEDNATLFEATVQHRLLLARIDILEKRGNRFRLIEVKAKSFRSDTEGSPFAEHGGHHIKVATLPRGCRIPDDDSAQVVPERGGPALPLPSGQGGDMHHQHDLRQVAE